MSTITMDLIHNVLDTRYQDFSSKNIEDAKNQLIDIIATTVSGVNAPGNSIMLDLIRRWGGSKEATILVHGDKVTLHLAAMMNSMMSRSFDYEAVGPAAMGQNAHKLAGHVPSTTVPTALSVAEYTKANGKDIISAVILGGDLAARIAVAEDFNYNHSFDFAGTVNAFGAVAVTSRLLGLNEIQTVNALGIIVNQIAGTFASMYDGVQTFKLCGAMSAQNAIIACQLAMKGFTGVKDPLLGSRGYFSMYCDTYHPDSIVEDLGKVFYNQGIHKKYPSCFENHNIIDCGLDIVQQHNVSPENIDSVIIAMAEKRLDSFLNQPFLMGDSQQKALFNFPYAIANVLLRKSIKIEHYTDEFIHDPAVIELADKVKIVPLKHSDEDIKLGVELTVKMKDGNKFSTSRYTDSKGDLLNPLTREDIKDKFWDNIEYSKAISRKNAQQALQMLENLENIENLNDIISLLVV